MLAGLHHDFTHCRPSAPGKHTEAPNHCRLTGGRPPPVSRVPRAAHNPTSHQGRRLSRNGLSQMATEEAGP
eukprot:7036127-Heterocapsa_arctica.AAC.1